MKSIEQYIYENTEKVERLSDVIYDIFSRYFKFDSEHECMIDVLKFIEDKNPDEYRIYYNFDTRLEFKEYVNDDVYRYAIAYNKIDEVFDYMLEEKVIYNENGVNVTSNKNGFCVKSEDLEFAVKFN